MRLATDVAVVGAGPAGAHAAYVLARRGARVTVFDPSHPREKPCGGGVTGRALALVRDALDSGAFARTAIRSARFTATLQGLSCRDPARRAEAPEARRRLSLADDALVVASRAAFDGALLTAAQRAGAIVERIRVTDVSIDPSGAQIQTTDGRRRAGFLIGADGANSLVRRRVAPAFRRDQLSIATGFFARGMTSDEIVVELTADPPGYIWSSPRPDRPAIGICAQADAGLTAGTLRARTADWIRATGIARGARLEPYSWPIPSLSAGDFDTLAVSGSRWALAGDA